LYGIYLESTVGVIITQNTFLENKKIFKNGIIGISLLVMMMTAASVVAEEPIERSKPDVTIQDTAMREMRIW
jgi:hypothetical protein